jgi:lipid-binding SYLF domain-containing protein
MTKSIGTFVLALGLGLGGACATVPQNPAERAELHQSAQNTVQRMTAEAPALQPMIDRSTAVIVFPSVKQGGLVVGAAGGRGIAIRNGQMVGFAELRQASIGALAGGQEYSEMIVVRDPATFDRILRGKFNLGAEASAVILRRGEGAATDFSPSGLAVFVQPTRGAMVDASLTGQTIRIKHG